MLNPKEMKLVNELLQQMKQLNVAINNLTKKMS
jgi:hypothetical protein